LLLKQSSPQAIATHGESEVYVATDSAITTPQTMVGLSPCSSHWKKQCRLNRDYW
jgi:hypothetical protein